MTCANEKLKKNLIFYLRSKSLEAFYILTNTTLKEPASIERKSGMNRWKSAAVLGRSEETEGFLGSAEQSRQQLLQTKMLTGCRLLSNLICILYTVKLVLPSNSSVC